MSAAADREAQIAAVQSQLAAIEEQMANLQRLISQMEAALSSVLKASDSIDGIVRHGGEEVIFPLDPSFNAAAKGRVLEKDRFIVHLGLEYYAEVDAATALKILGEKAGRLRKSLAEATNQLARLGELYEQYRALLANLLSTGQQAGREGGPR